MHDITDHTIVEEILKTLWWEDADENLIVNSTEDGKVLVSQFGNPHLNERAYDSFLEGLWDVLGPNCYCDENDS